MIRFVLIAAFLFIVFPYLFRCSQIGPDGKPNCTSEEDAARTALSEALTRTKLCGDIEFGGNLFSTEQRGQKCYAYDGPFHGVSKQVDIPWNSAVEANKGRTRSATYHSHPSDGNPHFSMVDLCGYIEADLHGYLVSSGGDLRRFERTGKKFSSTFAPLAKAAYENDLLPTQSGVLTTLMSNVEWSDYFSELAGVGTVTTLGSLAPASLGSCPPDVATQARSSSASAAYLNASANFVHKGDPVTLTWHVSNATNCTITKTDAKNATQTINVKPADQTTDPTVDAATNYRLTCKGSNGPVSQQTTVYLFEDVDQLFSQCAA